MQTHQERVSDLIKAGNRQLEQKRQWRSRAEKAERTAELALNGLRAIGQGESEDALWARNLVIAIESLSR